MATRAHYVPRFYLTSFAQPSRVAGRGKSLWVLDVRTGRVSLRSPKNKVFVERGLYDGAGGYKDGTTMEQRLSVMEGAAAEAIREYVARPQGQRGAIPWEVIRFIAWQAARTPAMREMHQRWADEDTGAGELAEPPPPGWQAITPVERDLTLRHVPTGAVETVSSSEAVRRLRTGAWRLVMTDEDFREGAGLQARYFEVRHLPRLLWLTLDAPAEEPFITSDRPCAWGFNDELDADPSWLCHPDVQLVAPLTPRVALLGVHPRQAPMWTSAPTAADVNGAIARFATRWIAGQSREALVSAARYRGRASTQRR
jgi:hypothetical protein